jgi:uncharacterized protein (DUF2336 family)
MAHSRFALLTQLDGQTSSDARRDLLRQVTDALSSNSQVSAAEARELDDTLAAVASEYSLEVRTEFARLVASSVSHFCKTGEQLALDSHIAVASPVLRHAHSLSEETLLRVVKEKSQAHRMAVTRRKTVSETISHALVEHGDDAVVVSLLGNSGAQIGEKTYEKVAQRAEASPALHAPLVQRQNVPLDLLHGLYQKVEIGLRREIMAKFHGAAPAELEKAFERSRTRVTNHHRVKPADYIQASRQLAALETAKRLSPPILMTLLRDGPQSATLFKLALARLTGVDYDVAGHAVDPVDLDTLALLCRAARFDRGLFVSIAIALDKSERGLAAAEEFGALYEAVSVDAAQRAMRFWKIRAA